MGFKETLHNERLPDEDGFYSRNPCIFVSSILFVIVNTSGPFSFTLNSEILIHVTADMSSILHTRKKMHNRLPKWAEAVSWSLPVIRCTYSVMPDHNRCYAPVSGLVAQSHLNHQGLVLALSSAIAVQIMMQSITSDLCHNEICALLVRHYSQQKCPTFVFGRLMYRPGLGDFRKLSSLNCPPSGD